MIAASCGLLLGHSSCARISAHLPKWLWRVSTSIVDLALKTTDRRHSDSWQCYRLNPSPCRALVRRSQGLMMLHHPCPHFDPVLSFFFSSGDFLQSKQHSQALNRPCGRPSIHHLDQVIVIEIFADVHGIWCTLSNVTQKRHAWKGPKASQTSHRQVPKRARPGETRKRPK